MSTISNFLGVNDRQAAKFISQAEKLCGYNGHDVRLISEVAAGVKQKIQNLSLDPADTTAKELYYNLRSRAIRDDNDFANTLGFRNAKDQTARLADIFDHGFDGAMVFSIKKAAARRLLTAVPPKQLMKKMHFKTAESMLKRQDINVLFGVIFDIESMLWKRKFTKVLRSLTASDFHEKPLEVLILPANVAKISKRSITPVYLTGAVTLNPLANFSVSPLYSSLQTLKAANQVLHWGTAVKQHQMNSNFSSFVGDHINNEPAGVEISEGLYVNYNHLQKRQTSLVDRLACMHLPLGWWKSGQYLAGQTAGYPVSLHIEDIMQDLLTKADFKDRHSNNFSQAFWHKLLSGYLQNPAFETAVLQKLNPEPMIIGEDSFLSELAPNKLIGTF